MTLSRAVGERHALARRVGYGKSTGYSYVFSCAGLILVAGLLIAALVAAATGAPGSVRDPDSQLAN